MKPRLLIAAVVVAVMLIALLSAPRLSGTVITPLQTAVATASRWVSDTLGGQWKARYEASQAALTAQREQQAELEELRQRNAWYHEFLGLKAENPQFVLAEGLVIAADPSDRYGGFTVNVGSLDDVTVGAAVISDDGLIGVVHTVGLNWCTVRTVYHPQVHISVMVNRTGERGRTAGGEPNNFMVDTLPRDSDAQAGDLLVTSGLGGALPTGLLVGEITSVKRSADGMTDIATAVGLHPVLPARVMLILDFDDKPK